MGWRRVAEGPSWFSGTDFSRADHQINPVRMRQVVNEMRACSQSVSAAAALNALWDRDGCTAVIAKSADRTWTTGIYSRLASSNLTNVPVILPVEQEF